MRTNLTHAAATTARTDTPNRFNASLLAVPLALAAAAGLTAALAGTARAGADGPSTLMATPIGAQASICHTVDEVKPALFPREQVVGYDFTGPDVQKLQTAMDDAAAPVATQAAMIRLVLLPATDEAIAFQFGADGCHTGTIELDFSQMAHVFEDAGVHAPFGATYYQLIGSSI